MGGMDAIRATFFEECEEQLAILEAGLMALETGDTDLETVNAVFRAVHSVKGGAGAFGLDALVRFAHGFETVLDAVRAGRVAAGIGVLAVMLRAADALADLVRASRDGTAVDEAGLAALSLQLAALLPDGVEAVDDGPIDFQPVAVVIAEVAPVREWVIRLTPRAALYANGNETALLLRELARLGETRVQLDTAGLPGLDGLAAEGAYLSWTVWLTAACGEAAIEEVFEFVEGDCGLEITEAPEPPAAPGGLDDADIMAMIRSLSASAEAAAEIAPPVPAKEAEPVPRGTPAASPVSIRVDLERVDRLIDLVGELVIHEAMLVQRVRDAGLPRTSPTVLALDELAQLTREIQDSVMAIRAQPVQSVFQRMPRLVREVAAATGKAVRLEMEGEATEVDRTIIERLTDPLTHMIRNAIDHGLEKPEVRAAAGKPAEGVVRLGASHRSGRIVISVSDDGAGIDRARVRSKAVERGLAAAGAVLSDDEVDNLIFQPGFTTAQSVSDVSGRGVGLDVVKRSVQALGGRIGIASRPGEGSVFTLSLPLTLAVLDGMVVMVAGQTLIVPLGAIVETLQPRARDVHGIGAEGRVIALRGGFLPLVDVGQVLGYRGPVAEPGVALLVEGELCRAVLLVDAVLGQRQVVIKSLEANYGPVPGIAAATVMGDGRVALILDVDVIADARPVSDGASAPLLMEMA